MACFTLSDDFIPPEPEVIEEDEAELELQKQLEKQRKLKQKQLLKDSGEKVNMFPSFTINCIIFVFYDLNAYGGMNLKSLWSCYGTTADHVRFIFLECNCRHVLSAFLHVKQSI